MKTSDVSWVRSGLDDDGARRHVRRAAAARADDDLLQPGLDRGPFLAGLPDDLRFVLALHEGSVVSMAIGHSLGSGRPALALLHSTPGLGNAVAAIATARLNRAPLVVLVGQQDRRHLALDPFLTGKLDGLAGEYPVFAEQPARAQDVPGAIVRAHHAALTHRGPALVIVPMDDWSASAPEEIIGPRRLLRSRRRGPGGGRRAGGGAGRARSARRSSPARAPTAKRGGARWSRSPSGSRCPVFQEPFGAQAGFPQDHPLFAGFLPARRTRLRETLAPFDAALVVGTGAIRQYPFDEGPLVTCRDDARARHAGPRGGAPQPGRTGRPGRSGGDLRRPGGDRRRAPTAGCACTAAAARRSARRDARRG